MLIYFFTFTIVTLLTFTVQQGKHQKKITEYIIMFACIMILSLVAAFRSVNVGADVQTYLIRHFNSAGRYNNLFSYLGNWNREYLYFTFLWLVSRFTDNIHFVLFFHQFILAGIVYYQAYKNRHRATMTMCIMAYMFLWYCSSYNIIRQSLAMFIILIAYRYMEEKAFVRYFICVVIAGLFHFTAIVCIFFPLVFLLHKHKYCKTIIISIVLLFIIKSLNVILQHVSIYSLLYRYTNYLGTDGNFHVSFFSIKLIILLGLIFFIYISCRDKNDIITLSLFLILDEASYASSMFISYAYRFSYFFLVFQFILIPRIDKEIKNRKTRSAFRSFGLISLIVYWVYRYVRIQYDGIYPYMFFWD